MALVTRKPKAEPIDSEALYEVVESFAVGRDVFQRGAKVRGGPIVRQHRALFMPANLDDLQKAAVRREYWGASYAAQAPSQQPAPPPNAPRPAGRVRSLGNWTIPDKDLGGPRRLNAGEVLSVDDPLVQRYWTCFGPVIESR